MNTQTRPSQAEISQTITPFRNRFKNPAIDKPVNRPVSEGYRRSLMILTDGITDYEKADIDALDTTQARAISVLAVDYLRGDCTQQVLVNVPLKD